MIATDSRGPSLERRADLPVIEAPKNYAASRIRRGLAMQPLA